MESSAGGGKAHDDPGMAPVGAAGTLLRPGPQTGSSPVDTSVGKRRRERSQERTGHELSVRGCLFPRTQDGTQPVKHH